MTVLAIDAGTTGVTALVVAEDARVLSRGYEEFPQHFPQPGWVEHEPEQIWQATLSACKQALAGHSVTAIGITNQRETAVLWDRSNLAAPRRAVVWQDRRSADVCDRLREAGHEDRVRELTGLRFDPYFTATKLAWLAENDERAWSGVTDGSVVVGTVDSYLVARLTGGRAHVTDASNASRTLLFDIVRGEWSEELCDLFGVPLTALPQVVSSYGEVGRTDRAAFLGLDVPVAGIAGDQQAALFGQACFAPGESKCTYGTGSFVLVNTGSDVVRSDAGLLSTVAWMDPSGTLTYALEGAIFVTGAAVQWLRDGLGIIGAAAESEALAASVPDSGGVVFVPALTGLGAPDWDPSARGAILGITRGTTRAHLARATLEAIAFEVRDVVATLPETTTLRVDGGAAANNLLLQLQADQLDLPVERPDLLETTGLGAAFLAGLGTGVWSSTDELASTWRLDRRFEPSDDRRAGRDQGYRHWRTAVERSKGWATV
ncbi:MAG: glycerol kinase [Actinomycetota bacterium]|nr:glycerol kinase [Actinomycetota bacterium]MDQ1643414.1 glycerol kinase [Actinomycetota bacterium]